MLAPDELASQLNVWDSALRDPDLTHRYEVLLQVARLTPRGYRFERIPVLRYGNPEIKERVVHLHLVEMVRCVRMLGKAPPFADDEQIAVVEDLSWEKKASSDYLELLATLAESTFSPEIYEAELMAECQGSLRYTYLASVNPETTLQLLLETRLRERRD
jgi:hypothetical protein